jgi:multifunctional 2-oxoglutarate metabolism enzyme
MVERGKRENGNTFAIARVEQLYPWPVEDLKAEIAKYPHLKKVRWVQDEPFNQGPWPSYALNVVPQLGVAVEPLTRAASSTTAVGTVKRHLAEQSVLIEHAFS